MPNPDGSLRRAELDAYDAKRDRERPVMEALARRERLALAFLVNPLNSLAYYRRYVEGVEALITRFRADEAALPAFEGTAFMRELYAEHPTLFGQGG